MCFHLHVGDFDFAEVILGDFGVLVDSGIAMRSLEHM